MRDFARRVALLVASAALATFLSAQQQPIDDPGFVNLGIRLVYTNDHPVSARARVELLSTSELSISQGFTDDQGHLTFARVRPGYYRLKVSGVGIEDTTTSTFLIYRGENLHLEFVHVQPKESPGSHTEGSQSPVSATELSVPERARKEFEAGMAALNEKNWPEAKKRFQKAVEVYPRYARAHNGLGVVYMNTGQAAPGRDAFETALRLDDHLSDAARNLAKIEYGEKKYSQAEGLLNKSLATDPTNAEARLLLSNAQLMLGKPEEALASARRVHTMEHAQYTLVHLIAAMALETLKRPAEAAAEYQLYLQESPTGPAAGRARAGLQALQSQLPH